MRRCLIRMAGIIRYEQPALESLLMRIDLQQTLQERTLTRLLHACAEKLADGGNLSVLFVQASVRMPDYGVLSKEDRAAFETLLGELGRTRLDEQLRLIDSTDERLRQREAFLSKECAKRMRLIRTLSVAGGAAVFLIMI